MTCKNMVCLTGMDGCGKSTQMEYLITWLAEVGIDYEYIRFQDVIVPQNKIIKSAIKYIKENHLEANDSIFESVYLGYKTRYLMEEILRPLLSTKKIVFVERYVESGFLFLKNRNLNNMYYKDIVDGYYYPQISIYLSVPAKCCYERILNRGKTAQHENFEYLKFSEDFFLSIIDKFDYVIDGCKKPYDIFREIQMIVCRLLNGIEADIK